MLLGKPILFAGVVHFYPSSTTTSSLPQKFLLRKLKFHPPVIGTGKNQSESLKSITAIRSQMEDGYYMRRSIELAKTAIGQTSPNPMVGCVIANENGEIVGEGFHPKAGQPHAEVFALRNAGNLAENATAYVSLEPCNHYGRTPPCSEALIKAKVKRVVVGMVDPNPIVASKGVEKLRASGISVTVGIEEEMCRKLNEAYIHHMLTGKPFLTARYTLSIEGNILNRLGEGSEELGGYYSQLLQEYDGIISSSNLLSIPVSQELGAKQPIQIIIAKGQTSSLSLPNPVPKSSSHVILFAEKPINIEPQFEGLEVVVLEQLSLRSILDYCGKLGLCSILIDIRGDYLELVDLLDDDCFREKLLQKVVIELCTDLSCKEELTNTNSGKIPIITKIANGDPSISRLKDLSSRVSNSSVIVEGYI